MSDYFSFPYGHPAHSYCWLNHEDGRVSVFTKAEVNTAETPVPLATLPNLDAALDYLIDLACKNEAA